MHQPRLLFLDAYDSFSNNIIALLHDQLNATVEVVRIDDKRFAAGNDAHFHEYLRRFDGVIAGPGPGDPRNPKDLGLMARLWDVPEHLCLPVLGVCLGFQSLALAFGASVQKLAEPRHGLITEVSHCGTSLFRNAGVVKATQYHSLHVRLDESCESPNTESLWRPANSCPSLDPIAWDLSDARNGPILMALKHESKPFWGVQYHPESICTNSAGALIIQNWWSEALIWSLSKAAARDPGPSISASFAFDLESTNSSANGSGESSGRSSLDYHDAVPTGYTIPTAASTPAVTRSSSRTRSGGTTRTVAWKCLDLPACDVPVTALLETIQCMDGNAVMLESGTKDGRPVRSETGRFSIIACLDASPRSLRYSTSRHTFESDLSGSWKSSPASMQDVWSSIDAFMSSNQAVDGPAESPFWGGLIGYISYEAGLETIAVAPPTVKETHPDVWFISVERSIVVDHVDKKLYLQSLHSDDTEWLQQTECIIKEQVFEVCAMKSQQLRDEKRGKQACDNKEKTPTSNDTAPKETEHQHSHNTPMITAPDETSYAEKVRRCQSCIRDGDSYELCLTDQSLVSYSENDKDRPSAWQLYKRLRTSNPAPFGAYLHFAGGATGCFDKAGGQADWEDVVGKCCSQRCFERPTGRGAGDGDGKVGMCDVCVKKEASNGQAHAGLTVLSSSPERFLSWSRSGRCQFRPIKGTVLKEEGVTREKAQAILGTEKEQAENLMIVDLIRHDLHGVVGSGNVVVQKLMSVEEYETVYQLVSVIEGQLPADKEGVDVLAASLPPGSMTGAPKKRSCELLKEIEGEKARGVYSGVLGYLDVGGGGDFSVVIRTAFQWEDEQCWRVGAGGAVTVLSTTHGEFDEMMAKRASSIRTFS